MRAKVIRGVYIRGTPQPEGAVGSVREDRVKQPGDAFAVSHQEFHELCSANYLAPHADAPVSEPAAPVPAPAVEPEKSEVKKGK